MKQILSSGLFMLCLAPASFAQLEQLEKGLGINSASGLSDAKVASGLKQALQIGSENAIKLTGK